MGPTRAAAAPAMRWMSSLAPDVGRRTPCASPPAARISATTRVQLLRLRAPPGRPARPARGQRRAQRRAQPAAAARDQRRPSLDLHRLASCTGEYGRARQSSDHDCQCIGGRLSSGHERRPLAARLAANIRQLREARGLTQEQMAQAVRGPARHLGPPRVGRGQPDAVRAAQGGAGAPGAARGADLRAARHLAASTRGTPCDDAQAGRRRRSASSCPIPSRAWSSTAWRFRPAAASPACPTCRARAST